MFNWLLLRYVRVSIRSYLFGARCAATGKGGHLILGYQKSVTTLASHSADKWKFGQVLKTEVRGQEP